MLTRLEQYARGTLRAQKHPDFAPPYATLNVGMISGGKAKNIIPGQMRLTLEWRPLPNQTIEFVLRAVEQLFAECRADEPGFVATVRPIRMDRGYDTPADADVVTFLEQASGKTAQAVSFGTEGPQLAAMGAVPVVFGPGDITVAHQTGEFVPVAELVRAAEILEAAVAALLRGLSHGVRSRAHVVRLRVIMILRPFGALALSAALLCSCGAGDDHSGNTGGAGGDGGTTPSTYDGGTDPSTSNPPPQDPSPGKLPPQLADPGTLATTDADGDGIADALEVYLAEGFSPEVRLAPDAKDWTRPANVDWLPDEGPPHLQPQATAGPIQTTRAWRAQSPRRTCSPRLT